MDVCFYADLLYYPYEEHKGALNMENNNPFSQIFKWILIILALAIGFSIISGLVSLAIHILLPIAIVVALYRFISGRKLF